MTISFLIISLWIAGCSSGRSSRTAPASVPSQALASVEHSSAQSKALPKAVIYRTNGDYNDNVPVNLNASRTALVSFPAPSDITSRSTPVEIGDGWLFDRRGGVGENTVFLTYTYAEYAALLSAPSSSRIMEAVIPGSGVTQCVVTSVQFSEALANPEILKQYIPQ